jgi:hypothetical protein
MSRTEIRAIPQRCGTCQHEHHGTMAALTGMPSCPTCGCTAYTVHAEELAAGAQRDADEARFYPAGGRILDGDMARGLHACLLAVEERIDADMGWDALPHLGVMYVGAPAGDDGAITTVPIAVAALDLMYARLMQNSGGNMQAIAGALAEMAEQEPGLFDAYRAGAGLDPRDPVIAWWASYEAIVRDADDDDPRSARDHPELVADELRQVIAVDVDERVHEITRLRSTGKVVDGMDPLPAYAAAMNAGRRDGVRLLNRAGIPPIPEALLRLMRVSRTETELRMIRERL